MVATEDVEPKAVQLTRGRILLRIVAGSIRFISKAKAIIEY